MNKIYHFINCTNRVQKVGKARRKRIVNLQWPEHDTGRIGTIFADVIGPIEKFIEEAEEAFESVLIYCNNGQNRSLVVMICYLMKRFSWSFKKTLGFLDSKNSSLLIKNTYFVPLQSAALEYCRGNAVSNSWYGDFQSPSEYREEEILLTNTFLNSQKMRAETELACMLSRQLKNRSCEKKVRKTVQWADRVKRDRVKAKSTQKTGKSNSAMKGKTIKPAKSLKSKVRANNVKTEYEESYDDGTSKKCGERKKFQLSNSTEFYQKNIKQLHMRLLGAQTNEKSGKNTTNNSYSKSTNAHEDLSNVEKGEAAENKPNGHKILKDGASHKKPKQFKESFLKDLKFLKVQRADDQGTEPETDKATQRSTKHAKPNKADNKRNGLSSNLDTIMRDKKLKARALKFDTNKFEAEKPSGKNESAVNLNSLANLSKPESLQFDSKTDNHYVKTYTIMKKFLEQKNPSFNTSIEPDKQKPALKSNKNSELFNKNDDKHKRPSSAPSKG